MPDIALLGFLPQFGKNPFSWLVGWFGFNGPLSQYFILYRGISHREGDRGEKG